MIIYFLSFPILTGIVLKKRERVSTGGRKSRTREKNSRRVLDRRSTIQVDKRSCKLYQKRGELRKS